MSRWDTDSICNRHDPAHLFLQGVPRQALGLYHKGEVFQRRPVQVEEAARAGSQCAAWPGPHPQRYRIPPTVTSSVAARQPVIMFMVVDFRRRWGRESHRSVLFQCETTDWEHSGMGAIPLGEIFHFNQKGSSFFPVHWVRDPSPLTVAEEA